MAYDIASAFEDIELSLIKSMRNNMRHHINEEYDEGINWTQWQAEMLSGLSQYRAQNKDVLTGYMGRLNDEIDKALSNFRKAIARNDSFSPAYKKAGILFFAISSICAFIKSALK